MIFTVFNTVTLNLAFETVTSNVFGYSFYLGWASGALLVASGFMMMASCKEIKVNQVSFELSDCLENGGRYSLYFVICKKLLDNVQTRCPKYRRWLHNFLWKISV